MSNSISNTISEVASKADRMSIFMPKRFVSKTNTDLATLQLGMSLVDEFEVLLHFEFHSIHFIVENATVVNTIVRPRNI